MHAAPAGNSQRTGCRITQGTGGVLRRGFWFP